MNIEYLRDILFDLINESDELDVQDIHWDSREEALRLSAQDGSKFLIKIKNA